jgi:hypothetical protein
VKTPVTERGNTLVASPNRQRRCWMVVSVKERVSGVDSRMVSLALRQVKNCAFLEAAEGWAVRGEEGPLEEGAWGLGVPCCGCSCN